MDPLQAMEPPPQWGNDEISNFLEIAHRNGYGTFVQLQGAFDKVKSIDSLFRSLIANLNHTPEWFSVFFVLRAHSSFLAACRMAASGQIPESYMVMRGCIENALYGFHISRRKDLQEIWLRRHDDRAAKSVVQQEFRIGTIFSRLRLANAGVADSSHTLYERTIDYGAHPNEQALMQVLRMERKADEVNFELRYLTSGEDPAFGACLKSTAQVGVCALDIFRVVFHERYQIIGLDQELDKLKNGL